MAEWLKAHAWKACLGETLTWVRIPLSPPLPQASLHEELMTNLFPRSATVVTVDQWIASLPVGDKGRRCPYCREDKDEVSGTAVTVWRDGTESQVGAKAEAEYAKL
jgi:hypothetical protein